MADTANVSKKVDDVTKPGETPADATARPVIVKHRAIAKDPMVAPPNPSQLEDNESTNSSVNEAEAKTATITHKAATVEPISSSGETKSAEAKPETNEKSSTNQEEAQSAKETTSAPSLGTAAVDVLADKAVKDKKDNKAEREKQELIAKHVEEKTYFAPIGQISKKKAEMRGAVVIVLLLLLVGAYVAIDAGYLLPDVMLPFEFIQ